MAEVITETIVPGTYIEVRAEGLLTVGAIATGNVGIIGTAEMGRAGVVSLGSYDDARATYGEPGTWDRNSPYTNLSLVRGLKYVFDNGARTVFAQRVHTAGTAAPARYELKDSAGATLLTLQARTPGEWGNRLQINVEEAESADAQEPVSDELVAFDNGATSAFTLSAAPRGGNGGRVGTVTVVAQGLTKRYQLARQSPSPQVVGVGASNQLEFQTAPAPSADVRATYWVEQAGLRRITLQFGSVREVYTVPSVAYLEQRISSELRPSRLVEVVTPTAPTLSPPSTQLPAPSAGFSVFAGGANGTATAHDYQAALDALVEQHIQLVIPVGISFAEIRTAVLGHVEKTENLGRERIAVLGAETIPADRTAAVEKVLANANEVADKRVILVAPGLRERDARTGQMLDLPASYAAAAVAGKLAGLAPHISLTNKTLAVEGVEHDVNYGQLTSLLLNRVLVLERKRGVRVVKGISTDTEAFKQISIRRIIDYAKEGTRQGANQYIGKLNNKRVRENLRTTLDSFLGDMLAREFLTEYKLDVFADRPMEIAGEVQVTMELHPTFSIDVIKVTMNLA